MKKSCVREKIENQVVAALYCIVIVEGYCRWKLSSRNLYTSIETYMAILGKAAKT
jgi:hypothetical protein